MKLWRLTTTKTSALRPIQIMTVMMGFFTVVSWGSWVFLEGYPFYVTVFMSLLTALSAGTWVYAYFYLRKHHPNMVKSEVVTKDLFVVDEDETKVH